MKKSSLRHIIRKVIQETLQEKKIGFLKGPEYSEEAVDLLKDFADTAEMLNKEIENKIVENDDPIVQEMISTLDGMFTDSEFIEDLEKVYELVQSLPDNKNIQKPKIGYKTKKKEKDTYTRDNLAGE
jgi:hypothetical protein